MPIKLIGKSILGNLGFCQVPEKMGKDFYGQLEKIRSTVPKNKKLVMTSMTGANEVAQTKGEYFPKIRIYNKYYSTIFDPQCIYEFCTLSQDSYRPGSDFILWDSNFDKICASTFSREAPILTFESSTGRKALGVILRPALMKYGDYLFKQISSYLQGQIKVTLVTCNHFQYPEGWSIPEIVQSLSLKHNMTCIVCADSEKNPECYHRGEAGNHVVAMW